MKELFIEAEVTIERFAAEDVVCTSFDACGTCGSETMEDFI